MTKLTIETLKEIIGSYPEDSDEIECVMARQLLAYEQAAKNPVAWGLFDASNGALYNYASSQRAAEQYRDHVHQSDDSLTVTIKPLYTEPQPAPVLPKQPDVTLTDEGNIPAQPVSEPYKFPQGWMKGQFAYQDLFNAIGAAVVSKHPSIEISVKAFEDSMLAAAPAQDGKSASTELPNHFNLSTNSPVIPDGWKLVPIEPTAEMAQAARDCHEGESFLPYSIYRAMLAAAPAQESE